MLEIRIILGVGSIPTSAINNNLKKEYICQYNDKQQTPEEGNRTNS
jgi:hypothetical protein